MTLVYCKFQKFGFIYLYLRKAWWFWWMCAEQLRNMAEGWCSWHLRLQDIPPGLMHWLLQGALALFLCFEETETRFQDNLVQEKCFLLPGWHRLLEYCHCQGWCLNHRGYQLYPKESQNFYSPKFFLSWLNFLIC